MIKITAVTQYLAEAENPISLKTLKFPTVQVDIEDAVELKIYAHLPSSDAVMTLFMVTDALRRAYPGVPVSLTVPYVPYARQDRAANLGEALSAKVFCDLINAQGYCRVVIQDPHSDVVPALLARVEIEDPIPAMLRVVEKISGVENIATFAKRPALVAPDAGARKRVHSLAKALELNVVYADKVRDTKTGQITGTQVQSELPDGPLLVVDDICDGGRTFIELAMAVRKQGHLHPIYLFVTHGIFSRGLDPLLEHYTRVFTRNNWTDDTRCAVV
jgi:ribose-phosphate pyrophosphokinase